MYVRNREKRSICCVHVYNEITMILYVDTFILSNSEFSFILFQKKKNLMKKMVMTKTMMNDDE